MDIFKRHPIPFAILSFLIITLPSAINNWLSLAERFGQAEGIVLIITDWGFPLIGLVLLIIVIRQRGGVKPPLFPKNETVEWLKQVLEDDMTHINSRIYGRNYIWDFKGLKEPDAFIELTFNLINATIFAINIQNITGRFLIEEHECAQEVEFNGSKRIPHSENQNIRIKQRLTRDMADLIIKRRDFIPTNKMEAAKKGKININIKRCQLKIVPEIENELAKSISFTIGGDYEIIIT